MAFIELEDLYGSLEVIAFENCYQASLNSLVEENIVLVEGRVSIKEEESISIIANKIQDFNVNFVQAGNTAQRKVLNINVTNLNEEQKNRLRGALKFFSGDRNNTQLEITNGEEVSKAGGIFLNKEILDEIQEIVGKENINM